ncbi:unnamed protein product [Camellia sinensis]
MSKCFSLTASRNWCYRSYFSSSGLRSTITDLGDGTVMHCWVPKTQKESKPNLLLIHGFGANAMWQWGEILRFFIPHFNVYVPDLVFFGDSYTTRPDRSETFQARCVRRVMEGRSVAKMSVVGLSYGGFVAYRLAEEWGEAVERVVICCAGVALEEKDLEEGLFRVSDLEVAAEILLPQTAGKMRELMRYTFVKPPMVVPSCLLMDFIHVRDSPPRHQWSSSTAPTTDKFRSEYSAWSPKRAPGKFRIFRAPQESNLTHGCGKAMPSPLGHHPRCVMCSEHVEEKKELIQAIAKDRKLKNLPKIPQPTLIVWGDQDQVFPLELGYRLKRHLGENARLVVIENTGHAFIAEKPKELYKHLKTFLTDSVPPTSVSTSPSDLNHENKTCLSQSSKPQLTKSGAEADIRIKY